MNGLKSVCGALLLAASFTASADALATLADAGVFQKAQKDVATLQRAELESLSDAIATCSAVSIGQRMQQYECERSLNLYWMHYSRGRPLDDYLTAAGGLFAAFDNNAFNPSQEMSLAYRRTASNLLALMKSINERYRQLEK